MLSHAAFYSLLWFRDGFVAITTFIGRRSGFDIVQYVYLTLYDCVVIWFLLCHVSRCRMDVQNDNITILPLTYPILSPVSPHLPTVFLGDFQLTLRRNKTTPAMQWPPVDSSSSWLSAPMSLIIHRWLVRWELGPRVVVGITAIDHSRCQFLLQGPPPPSS